MIYTIKNEFYTLTVNSLGAEMTSLISGNRELLWQSTNSEWWSSHAPLLFPVCGRIKDSKYTYDNKSYKMSTHGFANKNEFALAEISDSSITLTFSSSEETKKSYPFDFILEAKYELQGKKVVFSATVKNTDEKTLPYMFGWHPGFNLPTDNGQDIEDYCIDFGKIKKLGWTPLQNLYFARPYSEDYALKCGKYNICEKEIYENDTLIFSEHNNSISLYAEGHPYKLDMSWTENLPALCIWKQPDNAAKFICLEPWTGTPNDGNTEENFNTRKMERLAPGKSAEHSYTLEFTI